MRQGGAVVADDIFQNTPVVSGVSAMIGAAGLWLANRTLGRAAIQTALNDGFAKLMSTLQAEKEELREERDSLRKELEAERIARAAEHADLRGQIINLTQTVESLKNHLRRNGISVPEFGKLKELPGGAVTFAQEPNEED